MRSLADSIEALRRPAYTGARRCLPCTLVNLAMLAVSVAALARRRRGPALAIAALGTAAIWLRGYVVPYTPRFAPRLVASVPLFDGLFHANERVGKTDTSRSLAATDVRDRIDGHGDGDEGPTAGIDDDASDTDRGPGASDEGGSDGDGEALFERLFAAGVLVAGEDGDLALDDEFRERWYAEMDSLRSMSSETLATEALAVSPTASEARVIDGDGPETGGRWIALGDGDAIATETWLSRPIAIAEVGATRALEPSDLPPETRLAAARPLRTFLDSCPDCGGPVAETTTATCCGGVTNPRRGPREVLACRGCGERLFTFP